MYYLIMSKKYYFIILFYNIILNIKFKIIFYFKNLLPTFSFYPPPHGLPTSYPPSAKPQAPQAHMYTNVFKMSIYHISSL
jgi:hypothetical protein